LKVINAFWEKRNLGINCHEVIIDQADDFELLKELNHLNSDYQVVKVPTERPDLIFRIQEMGFQFVEISFECHHDLSEPVLDRTFVRLKDCFNYRIASDVDIELIKKSILDEIFLSDRVAIDPKFGPSLSAKRYVGWLEDEIAGGSKVYSFRHNDEPVGFFVLKESSGVNISQIGGVFNKFGKFGMGIFLNYYQIVVSRELGSSRLRIAFSSNNLPVFRISRILGFEVKPTNYVFVKHINNRH
jgi:hypothetical protein